MNSLESVLLNIMNVKVIDCHIDYDQYVALDFSISNSKLAEKKLATADDFENYIKHYLEQNNAAVAYGGYLEERNLYKRSAIFNDEISEERNIHIGLDLWCAAGTPVHAALDGTIHSYKLNSGIGDYGPTIILEHSIDHYQFYTLYGHLSLSSIEGIAVGQIFKKGQLLGRLGDASVNGDYAPHLHFQIIKDLKSNFGDYPGVCARKDLSYYQQNCPDPNLLLKINFK